MDLPFPHDTPCRVQPGDLWQLGRHRLLCGNCTDTAQVTRLMQGEQAMLTITSPPYNIGGRTGFPNSKSIGDSKYRFQADALPHSEYLTLLVSATEAALSVSDVVVVNLQMLAANKRAVVEYLYHFREHLIDVAIWDKQHSRPVITKNVLNARFEFLLFFTYQKSKGITPRTIPTANFRGTVENVYAAPSQRQNAYFRLHAATFPLHLPTWLIQTFATTDGVIFDPFLGTGTTMIAAEGLGRACFGIEIEPVYCEVAIARWEEHTGQRAQCLLDRNAVPA